MEAGAQGVEPPPEPKKEDEWVADWLDELCPYYMLLGVPCEQFWHGDYTHLKYYVKADEFRQQRANEAAWLQGAYVYDAIGRLVPVLQAFAKKGAKPKPYTQKPYDIGKEEEKTQAELKQIKENERLRSILFFKNWARGMQKKFSK